jgi:hypothetical protein
MPDERMVAALRATGPTSLTAGEVHVMTARPNRPGLRPADLDELTGEQIEILWFDEKEEEEEQFDKEQQQRLMKGGEDSGVRGYCR